VIGFILVIAASLTPFLPSPHDKDGWGLRVHGLSIPGPYLVGERPSRTRFDVTLINFSKEAREHDPLPAARVTGDLHLAIIEPDGKNLPGIGLPYPERNPFTQPSRLRREEFNSVTFEFGEFGYGLIAFGQVGRHRVEASIKIDGKTIKAPPIEFEVVAVPPRAVLVSHAVTLEGRGAKESSRPVIQQVPVGNRTLLIYRGHYDPAQSGGGPYFTTRLAELPGKVEMKVEGAYGDWGPITITYADKKSPSGTTTLVVHSIGGTPWTQGDQDSYNAKNKLAPAPREKKP